MPATRAKASPLAARDNNTRLTQVADKPSLKSKKKTNAKSGINVKTVKEAAEISNSASVSPATATQNALSPSQFPGPVETPATPRAVTELSMLIKTCMEGHKRQEKQLAKLVADVSTIKASMQAKDEKIDQLHSLVLNGTTRIYDKIDDVYVLVEDVSDNTQSTVLTLERMEQSVTNIENEVYKLEEMQESVNNIENEVERLSGIEDDVGRLGGIEDAVDHINDTCAQRSTTNATFLAVHQLEAECASHATAREIEETTDTILNRVNDIVTIGTQEQTFSHAILAMLGQIVVQTQPR